MDAILLSGGIDSIALAAWARPAKAITIDYGQVCASAELAAAAEVSAILGIEHHTISINCSSLGSGDLAGCEPNNLAPASDWWPFRNQLLLTLAAMAAVRMAVQRILIGTVRSDAYHADGSPQFIQQINNLCELQEGRIRVEAPAIALSSSELIHKSGIRPDVICWAHSCHTNNFACGQCRGCNKHREVMAEIGHESY